MRGRQGQGAGSRRDSAGEAEMDNTDDRSGSAMESARTSFWWAYGGKEGREVFVLKTTIRGTPGEGEIESHINSAIKAMGAVFRHGGRAKRESSNRDGRPPAPSDRASTTTTGGYTWGRARTGKSVLLIQKSAGEPDEIECPIHPGKIMKRRSNEGGSWLSHKEGDTYCTARIQAHESLES